MGYHDYICFIQNNGQDLVNFDIPDEEFLENFKLDYDCAGETLVNLVDVSHFEDHEIYTLPLSALKICEITSESYGSEGDWNLDDYDGYFEFIADDDLIFRVEDKKFLTISPWMHNYFVHEKDPHDINYCVFYVIFGNLLYLRGERRQLYRKYNAVIIQTIMANMKLFNCLNKKFLFDIVVNGTQSLNNILIDNNIWYDDYKYFLNESFQCFLRAFYEKDNGKLKYKKYNLPVYIKKKIAVMLIQLTIDKLR